jgi:flagellar hook assembly protein FlgD
VNNTLGHLELSSGKVRRGARLGVEFTLDHNARVAVTVEKTSGGIVRTLLSGSRKRGEVELRWNGRTASGKRPAAGRYLVRVHANNRLGAVELVDGFTVGA